METYVPLGIAVVSIVLTYFVCIRPMRRGHCMTMSMNRQPAETDDSLREITELRAEVAALRGEPVADVVHERDAQPL